MNDLLEISKSLGFSDEKFIEIEKFYLKIKGEAEASGYFLNPDIEAVLILIDGLLVNLQRYGYIGCPCRLSAKNLEKDMDIVCPCYYRDDDLSDFGACFCSLYVSKEFSDGTKKTKSIPERRLPPGKEKLVEKTVNPIDSHGLGFSGLKYPVYRCMVCGYLCAKDSPPASCPICKAGKERFERFI